jgi:hypothetical protein
MFEKFFDLLSDVIERLFITLLFCGFVCCLPGYWSLVLFAAGGPVFPVAAVVLFIGCAFSLYIFFRVVWFDLDFGGPSHFIM